MLRFVVAVLFCCSLIQTVQAQSVEQKPPMSCQFRELFNPSGWDIPGLSGAVTKGHGRYVREGIPENVLVDILEPQTQEATLTFAFPVVGQPDRLQILYRTVDVTQIEKYSMNGHIFGYQVTALDTGVNQNGKREHFGYQERVYYYDPDGSGNFTVQRDAGALLFKIIVPDWVKQVTSSQSKHLR